MLCEEYTLVLEQHFQVRLGNCPWTLNRQIQVLLGNKKHLGNVSKKFLLFLGKKRCFRELCFHFFQQKRWFQKTLFSLFFSKKDGFRELSFHFFSEKDGFREHSFHFFLAKKMVLENFVFTFLAKKMVSENFVFTFFCKKNGFRELQLIFIGYLVCLKLYTLDCTTNQTEGECEMYSRLLVRLCDLVSRGFKGLVLIPEN